MFSKEDILNELGKNIFIYPLNYSKIKDASVDLSISQYSWSQNNKKTAYNKDTNTIIIEPHDIVYSYTVESIYVTNKIGGIYSSLVSNCKIGINPISTNLDPNYIGFSLIVLHNITDNTIEIPLGNSIVSIQFFALVTPIYVTESIINHDALMRSTFPNDTKMSEFFDYCQQNTWSNTRRDMVMKYREQDFSKKLKMYKNMQKKSFSIKYRVFSSKAIRYVLLFIISIVIYVFVSFLSTLININISDIIIAFISAFLTIIANDLFKEIS